MSSHKMSKGEKIFFFGAIPSSVVAIVVGVLLLVSMNGNDPTVSVPEISSAPQAGVELPVSDLTGSWIVEKNGTTLSGKVANNEITLTMSTDNMNMVYWYGSFDIRATNGDTVISHKIDKNEIVMSGADSKEFRIGENTMSFEMTAMGVTRTVEMTRA